MGGGSEKERWARVHYYEKIFMKSKGKLKKSYGPHDLFCLKQFKEYIFTFKKRCRKMPTYLETAVSLGRARGRRVSLFPFLCFLVFTRSLCLCISHIYVKYIYFLKACWTRGEESRILVAAAGCVLGRRSRHWIPCSRSTDGQLKPGLVGADRSVGLPPTEPLSFPQGRPFLHPIGVLVSHNKGPFRVQAWNNFVGQNHAI